MTGSSSPRTEAGRLALDMKNRGVLRYDRLRQLIADAERQAAADAMSAAADKVAGLDLPFLLMVEHYGEGIERLDKERPNPWRTAVQSDAEACRVAVLAILQGEPDRSPKEDVK